MQPIILSNLRITLASILENYARTVKEIRVRRDAWPKVEAALLKYTKPAEPNPLGPAFTGIPIVLVDEQPRDVMFYPQDFEVRKMKRFWLSWYSARSESWTLERPWWVSGWEAGGQERMIVVAAVIAESQEAAKEEIVRAHDQPEAVRAGIEWRFCEERPDDWSPFCDRFPRGDWMQWPDPA